MNSDDRSAKLDVPDLTRASPEMRAQVWKGTQPARPTEQAERASRAVKSSAGTSYLISNRTEDLLDLAIPMSGGEMKWFMSTSQADDPNPDNYQQVGPSSTSAPAAFKTSIETAIAQQGDQLVVFVHGLGTLFDDAIVGTAALGTSLAGHGTYPGLVIGFDWPSYGEATSGLLYASSDSFPPTATSGTIRDNIHGSVAAFSNLVAFLSELKKDNANLKTSLVCHSEGNYMAMVGAWQQSFGFTFDNILMLAADINDGAFQQLQSGQSLVGQASYVAGAGSGVTVYFTTCDDVLPISAYMYEYDYHNALFGGRLGAIGPNYNQGAQIGNVFSVDCSSVLNVSNYNDLHGKGTIPKTSIHTSYLYVPQVAQDMSQVLQGIGAKEVANRVAVANPNAYLMTLTDQGAAATG